MFNAVKKLAKHVVRYQIVSIVDSFLCILAVVVSATYFMNTHSPVLLASMGASLVILLFAPTSPFARYWSFFGGHLISAFIGITCAIYVTPFSLASALAVSASISAMLALRCLHPPGAATALVPVISGYALADYDFLLPVLYNVLVLLAMVIVVNHAFLKLNVKKRPSPSLSPHLSTQDVQHALSEENEFIDVTTDKLYELLLSAEQQKQKRLHGNTTCGNIMRVAIPTVEYGDDVEAAWQTLQRHKLRAMPVLDKKNHVIGIVTWTNFLQFIDMSPYTHFQDKLKSFIRKTPDITTQKPEVVGHIMTKNVMVLPENTSIIQLITLFSSHEYGQIPIIDNERKFVGMVHQADVIKILNEKIFSF